MKKRKKKSRKAFFIFRGTGRLDLYLLKYGTVRYGSLLASVTGPWSDAGLFNFLFSISFLFILFACLQLGCGSWDSG